MDGENGEITLSQTTYRIEPSQWLRENEEGGKRMKFLKPVYSLKEAHSQRRENC